MPAVVGRGKISAMPTDPIHGTDRLETPERVDLAIDLAGVGSRTLAFLLDWVILIALTLLLSVAAVMVARVPRLGALAVTSWLIAIFVVWWLYFAMFEVGWDGQTPGKRILGIRVRKVGGFPIGWPEALIRNFLRVLIDLVMFTVPVGLVLMVLTRRHQRIGDLASGTIVVRERSTGIAVLDSMGFVEESSRGVAREATADLTTDEFELLHDFLSRIPELHQDAESRIRARLASVLRVRLERRKSMRSEWRSLGDLAFLLHVDAAYRGEPVTRPTRPDRGSVG
jgi:uncharacterized RDD family membrane protein YckC